MRAAEGGHDLDPLQIPRLHGGVETDLAITRRPQLHQGRDPETLNKQDANARREVLAKSKSVQNNLHQDL